MLKRDIIVRSDKETAVWRRDEAIPRKVNLLTRREEEIIGSHAWKMKHGYSPTKKY
jgi:hypothetical protein